MQTTPKLKGRAHSRRKSAHNRPPQRPVRLRVEAMEDRTVPASTVALGLGPAELGMISLAPHQSAQVGGTLYYVASDGTSTPALWKTDGTPAHTSAVAAGGLSGLAIAEIAGAGGSVYVAAAPVGHPNDLNVYKLDGSAPGGSP